MSFIRPTPKATGPGQCDDARTSVVGSGAPPCWAVSLESEQPNRLLKGTNMGAYTELVLKVNLIDIKQNIKDILAMIFLDGEMPDRLPQHEFFDHPDWPMLARSGSPYHVDTPQNYFDGEKIFSRSDFKSSDSLIDLFIDWLSPYIDGDRCIGWKWYDGDEEPELIYPVRRCV